MDRDSMLSFILYGPCHYVLPDGTPCSRAAMNEKHLCHYHSLKLRNDIRQLKEQADKSMTRLHQKGYRFDF